MWEPPLPEELQALLPQYEITGILGRGGMGAVYRGRQPRLDRDVAIKLLPETLLAGGDEMNYAKRFEQEAQAMAKLSHPGIIAVYDFGETSAGQFYFVMEFIDGMDIHQYLKQSGGKIPQNDAIAIVSHVLDALSYAHSHGIVHRDIKPANILLDREGRIKIADFGLAKRFTGGETSGLTLSNVAVGTPDFVAPESLVMGRTVDQRADIYAVGVMLYQLLTGQIPRAGYKFPSELDPEIDSRLDEIVSKAIEPDPEFRYSSAEAVRSAIDIVLTRPISRVKKGTVGSVAKSKIPLYAGIGIAAVLVISLIAFFAMRPGEPESKTGTLPSSSPATSGPRDPALARATKDQPFVNSLGMKFVPVPGTKVLFCIHEARYKDYAEYAKEEKIDDSWRDQTYDGFKITQDGDNHPVSRVSWDDAQKFCEWLSKKEGKTYRLPTDEEWSYAVGIGDRETRGAGVTPESLSDQIKDHFPWGTEWPPPVGADNYSDQSRKKKAPRPTANYLEGYDDGFPTTAPVMSFAPNNFGLYDLGGNVLEWCEDLISNGQKDRVLRGASQNNSDRFSLLSSRRTRNSPEVRNPFYGFRVVLVSEGGPKAPTETNKPSSSQVSASPSQIIAPSSSPAVSGSRDSALAGATKDQPFVNSLGMKFVPVPGTHVLFCIHETRYKDYAEYAKEEKIDDSWRDQTYDGFEITQDSDNHPVSRVSWDDAQKFCKWLSKKEGKTYRLPTDEEWSYAVGIGEQEVRGDSITPASLNQKIPDHFPWGAEWPPPAGAGNYSDASRKAKAPSSNTSYLDGYDDGFTTTAPVMSFAPNKLGLYDMGGNVWEWCEDLVSEEHKERVLRGGSWGNCERGGLHSSSRTRFLPGYRSDYYGFRVVLVSEGTPKDSTETSKPTSLQVSAPPAQTAPASSSPATSDSRDSALARATKDQPFVNSLGMKFVPVPGTKVLFCIHETRYKDYAEYAKEEKEKVNDEWKNQTYGGFEIKQDGGDHPVTKVSWNDAQMFCEWLSKKEGKTYRLPTDEEWSYAVGIGEQEAPGDHIAPASLSRKISDRFPWGTEWPPPAGAGNYSDQSRKKNAPYKDQSYLEGYDDGFPTTAPVMSFTPSKLGLYDLGGNVLEWCEDWASEERELRVVRGSAWLNCERHLLLSSVRPRYVPDARYDSCGFRVVLALAPSVP